MNDMELRIFQSEVQKQSEFALQATNAVNGLLKQKIDKNINNQIWFFVQSFLIATANVSKLLWGSKKNPIESRKSLRESLDVTENTFQEIRNLRNHFEHFDERIETWAATSGRQIFADSNIGPTNMITGIDTNDFLRNFDTTKGAITFKGQEYILQPIVDELIQIHEKAITETNKHV